MRINRLIAVALGLAICFAANAVAQEAAKPDIQTYIRDLQWGRQIPYTKTRANYSAADVPKLFDMLNQPDDARSWAKAVAAIGILGTPDDAAKLLEFFKRAENWQGIPESPAQRSNFMRDRFTAKIEALTWVGKLGGKSMAPMLASAMTDNGAAELSKAWYEQPETDSVRPVKADLIQRVCGWASVGVVYTGDAPSIEKLREIYALETEKRRTRQSTAIQPLTMMTTAMASADAIAQMGMDRFFQALGDPDGATPNPIDQYSAKYSVRPNEPKDVCEFLRISPNRNGPIPIRMAMNYQNEQSIQLLHEMLMDPADQHLWGSVYTMLGYLSKNPASVDAMMDYFQRADEWNVNPNEPTARAMGRRRVTEKMLALQWIGRIDPERATPILQKALTLQGAEELAAKWINDPRLPEFSLTRAQTIGFIRGYAGKGLIFTQKPENIDLVIALARESNEPINDPAVRQQYGQLVDALMYHLMIQDMGMEQHLISYTGRGDVQPPDVPGYLKKAQELAKPLPAQVN
jgi:hypothetical protein